MHAQSGDLNRDVPTQTLHSVFVYEAPMRIWHWINALSVIVLIATGYYIGNPLLPAMSGEASANFFMGYVRFAHFAASYIFAVGLLGRIYWALAGNQYARHLIFPALFSRQSWIDAWHQLRYYLFLEREQKPTVGANALDEISTFFMFTLPSLFLILTGFALYSQGSGGGSWQDTLFGWVIPLFGGGQSVHTWHHLAMWVMICYLILHLYLVVRQDIMTRQSYISTMVNGYRMFKD